MGRHPARIFAALLTLLPPVALLAQAPRPGLEIPVSPVAGPLEQRASPITATNPVPGLRLKIAALYPVDAAAPNIRGTVTLRVTVDALGHVGEVRQAFVPDLSMVDNGDGTLTSTAPLPRPFVVSALDAVRQWQYDPPAQAPVSFYVRLAFAPDRQAEIVWQDARPPATATVGSVIPGGSTRLPSPPIVTAVSGPVAPVRVGGNIKAPARITNVAPAYPAQAKANGVYGIVILEVTIDANGNVTGTKVLRSIPDLDQAAIDAVRQWKYEPTLLNGQPTPIVMSVTVNFTLS